MSSFNGNPLAYMSPGMGGGMNYQFGPNYNSIYGSGGYTPAMASPSFLGQSGSVVSPLLNMGAGMLMPGGVPTDPFGAMGMSDAIARMQMQQLIMDTNKNVSRGTDQSNIANIFASIHAAANGGQMTDAIRAQAGIQASTISGMLSSIPGQMIMGQLGLDLSSIAPGAFLGQRSLNLANSMGMIDRPGGLEVANLATMLDKSMYRDGRLNRQMMQGFTPAQYVDAITSFSAKGLLSPISDLSTLMTEDGPNSALLDRMTKGARDMMPAMAAARGITGSSDPESLFQTVQAITGGGIGQMSADQVSQEVQKFKEISRAANVSAKAMMDLINSSINISRQYNIDSTVMAQLTTTGVLDAQTAANALSNSIDGSNTPGFNRTSDAMFDTIQRLQVSSARSPFVGRNAVAIRMLDEAGKLGDLKERAAAGDATAQQLLAFNDGTLSGEALDAMRRNQSGISSLVSSMTGADAGFVAGSLNNRELQRSALAWRPDFAITGTLASAQANLMNNRTVQQSMTALGLTRKDSQLVSELIVASMNGDPDVLRNAVTASGRFGDVDDAVLRFNAMGQDSNAMGFASYVANYDQIRARRDRVSGSARFASSLERMIGSHDPIARAMYAINDAGANGDSLGNTLGRVLGVQGRLDILDTLLDKDNQEGFEAAMKRDPKAALEFLRMATGDKAVEASVSSVSGFRDRLRKDLEGEKTAVKEVGVLFSKHMQGSSKNIQNALSSMARGNINALDSLTAQDRLEALTALQSEGVQEELLGMSGAAAKARDAMLTSLGVNVTDKSTAQERAQAIQAARESQQQQIDAGPSTIAELFNGLSGLFEGLGTAVRKAFDGLHVVISEDGADKPGEISPATS